MSDNKNYLEEEIKIMSLVKEKKLDEISLRKEWIEEARKMTLENLPAFIKKLTEHEHDYGVICVAIGAAATATAWAIQNSEYGGITGFQASFVMWEFIVGWNKSLENKRLSLIQLEDMLYPQYSEKFTTITKEDFEKLQSQANELLKTERGVDRVRAHWQSIVDGIVPFGYKIKD